MHSANRRVYAYEAAVSLVLSSRFLPPITLSACCSSLRMTAAMTRGQTKRLAAFRSLVTAYVRTSSFLSREEDTLSLCLAWVRLRQIENYTEQHVLCALCVQQYLLLLRYSRVIVQEFAQTFPTVGNFQIQIPPSYPARPCRVFLFPILVLVHEDIKSMLLSVV